MFADEIPLMSDKFINLPYFCVKMALNWTNLALALNHLENYNPRDKRERLREIENILFQRQFTSDLAEEYGVVEKEVHQFDALAEKTRECLELREIVGKEDEEEVLTDVLEVLSNIKDYILRCSLKGEYDPNGAIVELNVWKREVTLSTFMMRLGAAYHEFAQRGGLEAALVHLSSSQVVYRVNGRKSSHAYGMFRNEHGVHRVVYEDQRGKRQTGHLSVLVSPDIDLPSIELDERLIKTELLSGSTNGGQHANKTSTCVRLSYQIPGEETTIFAKASSRSQYQNLRDARRVLQMRVARYNADRDKQTAAPEFVTPIFGNRFRSYFLVGDKRIVDDRSGMQSRDLEGFFAGRIDPFIYAAHG